MVKTAIQIRFGDIDGVGHINNGAIVAYYDLGINQYFTEVGIEIGDNLSGDIVAKVNININFLDSILPSDDVVVTTYVSKIGNRSLTLYQEIIDMKSEKIKSNCTTVMAGINKETLTSANISDKWKELIRSYENL